MKLYPGAREKNPTTNTYFYSLSSAAMANSMAQVMEDEMSNLFSALKQQPLPANGKEGRLMLFAAVARGVLKYLNDNQHGNVTDSGDGSQIDISINMDHT